MIKKDYWSHPHSYRAQRHGEMMAIRLNGRKAPSAPARRRLAAAQKLSSEDAAGPTDQDRYLMTLSQPIDYG
jgi:hypothetical protein